jgi:hypothetical protein
VKFGAGGFIVHKELSIYFPKLALVSGEKIGSLVFERLVDWDSISLQSTHCEGSIIMTVSSVSAAPPEKFIALLYPSGEWRTLYVHRGQTYDNFARIPAYLRFLESKLIAAMTLSAPDLSDGFFFSFHIPVGCALDRSAAVAASNTVIALASSSGR